MAKTKTKTKTKVSKATPAKLLELEGKTVVVTGTLAEIKRAEAEAKLRALGAKVTKSVSKRTDLLFVGAKPGSKLKKAESLGVPVFAETALMAAIAKLDAKPKTQPTAKVKVKTKPVAALAGKTIVVTGKLAKLSRAEAKAHILAAGATPRTSVSPSTDLVVLGAKAGSKAAHAERFGVETVNEDQFLRMIGDARAPKSVELLGALADFLPRYEAMLAELEADPGVRVIASRVAPPASEADIEAVHAHLGAELDPAILNFYRQCDGLQLMWLTADNPTDDADNTNFRDYHPGDGAINIHSLRDTFVDLDWHGIHHFDFMNDSGEEEFAGESYPLMSFSKSLRVFDDFHFYNMAGFVMIAAEGEPLNPPISIGDDHGACWTDARLTDFESYMELVLASYGSIAARRRILLTYAGHRRKPLRMDKAHWDAHRPRLDEILDEARENQN